MAIERFMARRGAPAVLWSDNGTNFVGAEKELLACVQKWNQEYFAAQLAVKSVRWKFNPPASPHHGGAWERLIRSFKRTFYAVLGNRRLTDDSTANYILLGGTNLELSPANSCKRRSEGIRSFNPKSFFTRKSFDLFSLVKP